MYVLGILETEASASIGTCASTHIVLYANNWDLKVCQTKLKQDTVFLIILIHYCGLDGSFVEFREYKYRVEEHFYKREF